MDENVVMGIDKTDELYAHPVFQAVFSFGLEFLIIPCISWPIYTLVNQSKHATFKTHTNFFTFLFPASMDFLDKLFLLIGISLLISSLPPMILGFVPVIAGLLSMYLFYRKFTML